MPAAWCRRGRDLAHGWLRVLWREPSLNVLEGIKWKQSLQRSQDYHAGGRCMNGGIFLIQSSGQLVEMKEESYDSEEVLQELLAKYPNLLAGDQMDTVTPRKWLLVSREMGVPSEEEGADRWSLDHLFLDQDAIPTLVEVKRSSDTRIRREVVGQLLDYAANAVVYWPVETIRARFEQTCREGNLDPAKELTTFLGVDSGGGDFWQRVKLNLQAGRVRMLFVADEIPEELRRIVEFLNSQLDPAEVLAVEVRQYVGHGLKTLVPRVFGQTEKAVTKKQAGAKEERPWDEASFLDALRQRRPIEEVEVARSLLDWAKKSALRIWWGKGAKDGSFFPMLDHDGEKNYVISVWTYGRLYVQFERMKDRPPFDSEAKRQELRELLNRIPGVDIAADAIARQPLVLLSALVNQEALRKFLDVLDWHVRQVRATE
jgi:hypothetical protein